jgi:hypothetical protein
MGAIGPARAYSNATWTSYQCVHKLLDIKFQVWINNNTTNKEYDPLQLDRIKHRLDKML